jgi:cytoskeletal protein CcmA (bactofilin family)
MPILLSLKILGMLKSKKVTNESSPIILSAPSVIDGQFKTNRGLRIECQYFGAVVSSEKIYVSTEAKVVGDLVCNGLTVDGEIKGDVYCTGKVLLNEGAKVTGNIYAKLFENRSNENLSCTIRIPNPKAVHRALERLESIDLEVPMTGTNLLNEISLYFTSRAQSEGSEAGLRVVDEEPSLRSSGSDS